MDTVHSKENFSRKYAVFLVSKNRESWILEIFLSILQKKSIQDFEVNLFTMQNSKLIQVLKTFTKDEWKGYEKLVASPFFNKGRNLMPFVKALKKFYPEFNNLKLTKEYVYTEVYKDRPYNNNTMKAVLSALHEMATEYLFQKTINGGFLQEKYLYLSFELDSRFLRNEALNFIIESDMLWEKYGIDEHYFRGKTYTEILKMSLLLNNDEQKLVTMHTLNKADYSTFYYISSITKALKNMIANKFTFNADYEKSDAYKFLKTIDIDSAIKIFKSKQSEYRSTILVYLYALKSLLIPGSEESYMSFRDLFFEGINEFSNNEKYDLFTTLTSVIQILSIGDYRRFSSELFGLYRLRLEKKAYKHEGSKYFPIIIFRSTFHSAVNAGEMKWAVDFTKKYINELNPVYRKSIKYLFEAMILTINNVYEEALGKLKNIHDDFIFVNFDKRALTIICLNELKFYENALSLLDASLHFLKNNKNISPHNRTIYGKFFQLIQKIIKMDTTGNYEDCERLRKYTISNLPIPFSKWLIGKLESY